MGGGRHSGRGGGIAEAPGSVKTIDQSVIYGRFYAIIRGEITLYPKRKTESSGKLLLEITCIGNYYYF
jgi:hypothetical protein